MRNFHDRVAVVTGAGSGIGRALALDLAGRGARLAISDVDTDGLAATRTRCEALGAEVHAARLDVTDRDAVFAHADEVERSFGVVHLVVNNAGVALAAMATDQTMEDLDTVMGVDWWGVAHGTQAFLPKLVASGDGALVNISSLFGLIGVPSQSGYNAAKFAVRGYTEAIAQEAILQGLPITVHCVHPGGIRTNIAASARTTDDWEGLAALFEVAARTSPEACARTILRGVERNRARILVGADAWALHLLQQVTGVRGLAVVRRAMARAQASAQRLAARAATEATTAEDAPTAHADTARALRVSRR